MMILILFFIASCISGIPDQGFGIPIVPTNDGQCFMHAPMSVLFWIKPVRVSFESEQIYEEQPFTKHFMKPFFNDMRERKSKFKSICHGLALEKHMKTIDSPINWLQNGCVSDFMDNSPINWLEIISHLPFEVQDKKTFAMLQEDYIDLSNFLGTEHLGVDLSHVYGSNDSSFRSGDINVQDDATKFLIVTHIYLTRNNLTEFPTYIEQNGRFELFSISMNSYLHTWSWVHLKKNDTKWWYNLDDSQSSVKSYEERPKCDAENKESVGVYVKSKEYDSLIYPIVEPSLPSQTIYGVPVAVPDGTSIGPDGVDLGREASTSWELEFFKALLIFALIRL